MLKLKYENLVLFEGKCNYGLVQKKEMLRLDHIGNGHSYGDNGGHLCLYTTTIQKY